MILKFPLQYISVSAFNFKMNIRDFKMLVNEKTHIPIEAQKLIFSGKMFNDALTLDNYLTTDNLVVYLLGKSWYPSSENATTSQTNNKVQQNIESNQTSGSKISNPNNIMKMVAGIPVSVFLYLSNIVSD